MKLEKIPVPGGMTGPAWAAQPWLGSETLNDIAELNAECLRLLVEQAQAPAPGRVHPLLCDVAQLGPKLDASALMRAAACPYLLMDSGFADPQRWMWAHGQQVLERERGPTVPFFTVPRARSVMRTVLTYGWYLAQSRQSAARVLFGMSGQCVKLVRGCTLGQVGELADKHPAWLQPRWPQRVRFWRELLSAAVSDEGPLLEQAQLRGLQILAADARAAGAER